MTEAQAQALAQQIEQESRGIKAEAMQRRRGKWWAVQLTLKSWRRIHVIENQDAWPSLKEAWSVLQEVQV